MNSIHLYLGWLLINEDLVLPFYLSFSDCSMSPVFLFLSVSVFYFSLMVFYGFFFFFLSIFFFMFCVSALDFCFVVTINFVSMSHR